MLVYLPKATKYPAVTGRDYPAGWQDIGPDDVVRAMLLAGIAGLESGGVTFSVGADGGLVANTTNSAGQTVATPVIRHRPTLARSLTGRSRALALTDASFPANSNINGLTFRSRIALAGHFDAVRIHLPNMHTAAVAGVKVAIGVTNTLGAWATTAPTLNNTGANTSAAPSNTEAVNTSGGVLLTATFSRQATVSLPSAENAANLTPSWTTSDWCPIKSLDRSDGGIFPLLDVAIFYPAGTTATMAYTGASGLAWAMWGRDDTPSNGRVWRSWMQDGDYITTPGGFTVNTTTPANIPFIIEYRSKKRGYTILLCGDSIYDAHNLTYPQNGFAHQALSTLHSSDAPVELCNISVPGATTLAILERAQIVAPKIRPSVIVAESNSVNNFGTSLGARVQQHGEGTVGGFCALSNDLEAGLVVCSQFPVTNAAKAYGATDSQRTTLNAALAARVGDFVWLDWSSVVDGTAHASGQIEPNATYIQGDGIHYNGAGHAAMVPIFVSAVSVASKAV